MFFGFSLRISSKAAEAAFIATAGGRAIVAGSSSKYSS